MLAVSRSLITLEEILGRQLISKLSEGNHQTSCRAHNASRCLSWWNNNSRMPHSLTSLATIWKAQSHLQGRIIGYCIRRVKPCNKLMTKTRLSTIRFQQLRKLSERWRTANMLGNLCSEESLFFFRYWMWWCLLDFFYSESI